MTGLLAISDHLAGADQCGRQRQAPSGQQRPVAFRKCMPQSGHAVGDCSQLALLAGTSKTKQVVVACAYSLPCSSSTRASVVAICRPAWITVPTARSGPVLCDAGRTMFKLSSAVVWERPAGSAVCTAQPMPNRGVWQTSRRAPSPAGCSAAAEEFLETQLVRHLLPATSYSWSRSSVGMAGRRTSWLQGFRARSCRRAVPLERDQAFRRRQGSVPLPFPVEQSNHYSVRWA